MKFTRYTRLPFSFFITLFVLALTLHTPRAFAASTTMGFTPQTGSYSAPFSVSLVIDGHGDVFNAARATVTIPKNLTVKDLELGDCNFSFRTTPSIDDPSFEGAILASSSKKCTVYTLTLLPTGKGDATVSLGKATVRRFSDAAEVLSSTQNGAYTITGTVSVPAQTKGTVIPTPANGLYVLSLKVLNSDTAPVSNAVVTLNMPSGKNPPTATTNRQGTVLFSNLKSGVYRVKVSEDAKQVADTIINVVGANHVLSLSINLKSQQTNNPLLASQQQKYNPYFLAGIAAVSLLVGIGIAFLPRLFKRRKKSAS